MEILESVKAALEGIWLNKLRSTLTMLGIIIGVAAVIAVIAIGEGGRASLTTTLEGMGTNRFVVYPSSKNSTTPLTKKDMLTLEDVEAVRTMIPTIKLAAPASYLSMMSQYGKEKQNTTLIVCNTELKAIRNLELAEGRFFYDEEDKSHKRVVVINEELARTYFHEKSALGKQIYISNTPFTVVGVIKDDDRSFLGMGEPRKDAYLPFGTVKGIYRNLRFQLECQATSKDDVQEAMDQTIKLISRRHHSEGKYRGWSMNQEVATVNEALSIVSLIVGSIAGISLLVGGIGVMNIMLVSVTERTREVGIRMALGARRKDILIQFLIESVVICLVGGIMGTCLGAGGAVIVAHFAKWPPLISIKTIVIAFLFSASIGITFGIYPANKAAKLDPIEALRYE